MICVGFHNQDSVVGMSKPSSDYRRLNPALKGFSCKEMAKGVKGKLWDSGFLNSRVQRFFRVVILSTLLALVFWENQPGWFVNSLEKFFELRKEGYNSRFRPFLSNAHEIFIKPYIRPGYSLSALNSGSGEGQKLDKIGSFSAVGNDFRVIEGGSKVFQNGLDVVGFWDVKLLCAVREGFDVFSGVRVGPMSFNSQIEEPSQSSKILVCGVAGRFSATVAKVFQKVFGLDIRNPHGAQERLGSDFKMPFDGLYRSRSEAFSSGNVYSFHVDRSKIWDVLSFRVGPRNPDPCQLIGKLRVSNTSYFRLEGLSKLSIVSFGDHVVSTRRKTNEQIIRNPFEIELGIFHKAPDSSNVLCGKLPILISKGWTNRVDSGFEKTGSKPSFFIGKSAEVAQWQSNGFVIRFNRFPQVLLEIHATPNRSFLEGKKGVRESIRYLYTPGWKSRRVDRRVDNSGRSHE